MESPTMTQGCWRRNAKRLFGFLLIALYTLEPSPVLAADSDRSDKDDEYSFNWLDPDKKIYVLQNRKYLKAGRPQISILAGTGFSNPYRTTYNLEPRVSFFISEAFGIELFYTAISNVSNPTVEALSKAAPNVAPGIREIRSQYGGLVQFIPWYAKINVFNSILYFDWYFSGGAGSLQTFANTTNASTFAQQDLFGVFLGTGHLFHLGQSLVFRLDLTAVLYQAPVNGTSGDSSWYSSYNFGLGLGWKL